MTLVEAFRRYGPGEEEAGDLILRAANEMARRVAAGLQDRDDLIQTILFRLAAVGPRGIRDGDPETDDQVKGYLGRAIKYGIIDAPPPPPEPPDWDWELPGGPELWAVFDESSEAYFWQEFEKFAESAGNVGEVRTLKECIELNRTQPNQAKSKKQELLDRNGITNDGWRQRELRARKILFGWLDLVTHVPGLHETDRRRILFVGYELFKRPDRSCATSRVADGVGR